MAEQISATGPAGASRSVDTARTAVAAPSRGTVADVARPLVRALLGHASKVRFEFWDGSSLGPTSGSDRAVPLVRFMSVDALRRVLWMPNELGLCRAYVAGEADIVGDIFEAVAVLRHPGARRADALRSLPMAADVARRLGAIGRPLPPPPEEARLEGWRHSVRRDAQAITHHYDVGNDFYRLVLGNAMTYSCARFVDPSATLEDAQAAKHDLVCRKLGLHERQGARLLDVGCGWGSMAIHAATTYGAHVVGITISRAQAERARQRVSEAGLDDRVEIRLQDYRELGGESFDAVSSIGMSEHVGHGRIDEYFSLMRSAVRLGGRLLNHAISSPGGSKMRRNSFVGRYVFPDGELVDVGDTVLAMERAGFEVRDVESLREHYAATLRQWVANLEANWAEAVALAGEPRARVWRLYMAGSAIGFEEGRLSIHQVLGTVPDSVHRSGMPATRRAWEPDVLHSPCRSHPEPPDSTVVSSIVVSELAYAPPGADQLFFDVSFGVAPGEHAAIVGANGVGKSTILRILGGVLEADEGDFAVGGSMLTMTQDVGMSRPTDTLREMLLEVASPLLRTSGKALVAAERALADGTDDGMGYAEALADWGDHGGYELEAKWAAAAQRSVKTPIDDFSTRLVGELSGGERKRMVLDLLLTSGADVLLLDEPDNYLDIPTRGWLEDQIKACRSTILMVSHDRTILERVATKIVVIEGSGCWVHGGSYTSFPAARERRQELMGDDLKRWNDEERRLFHHMKIMKQRAAQNFKNATKANAAETRWEKFVAIGPPPPPVPNQQIHVRLRGADAARRVAKLVDVSIGDLFLPFSDEVHHGERLGLIGPNGTGKTHLLSALAGTSSLDHGEITFGPRTSIGMFNQINDRPDFQGRQCVEIVRDRVFDDEKSMKALARYGLRLNARQEFQTLSGGQKARMEILCLELEGHNVLLLDEPTDNLDVESSEALEQALDGFEGTVIAVSHDRTFLEKFDRFVMITDDGEVYELPDFDVAMKALAAPDQLAGLRLAKNLT